MSVLNKNDYGEVLDSILRDLYRKSRAAVPESELTDLKRLFSDFAKREEKYKAMLGVQGVMLSDVSIRTPHWLASPLDATSLTRTADVTIANDTITDVVFDQYPPLANTIGQGFSKTFTLDTDLTTVRINGKGLIFHILGIIDFTANANGVRQVYLDPIDSSGASLGAFTIVAYEGSAQEEKFPICYTFVQLETMVAMKFQVYQNRGGTLDLKQISVGLSIA